MVFVWRLLRRTDADEPDDVCGGIGDRMEAVREDADRAACVAERDLGRRDREVQQEDARENSGDGAVTLERR